MIVHIENHGLLSGIDSILIKEFAESKSKEFKYVRLYIVSNCTDCSINHFIKHCERYKTKISVDVSL